MNDLRISLGLKFAYQILDSDLLDRLRKNFQDKMFGFGGISILGKGYPLPTDLILMEMARLNCGSVILRRAFKRDVAGKNLRNEISLIRKRYEELLGRTSEEIASDRERVLAKIREIVR